jgi:hypothetical protein
LFEDTLLIVPTHGVALVGPTFVHALRDFLVLRSKEGWVVIHELHDPTEDDEEGNEGSHDVEGVVFHWPQNNLPSSTKSSLDFLGAPGYTGDMKPEFIAEDPILQYFTFAHLTSLTLQRVSKEFHDIAEVMATNLPRNPERTVVFRKLLEAKDAAVRAALD